MYIRTMYTCTYIHTYVRMNQHYKPLIIPGTRLTCAPWMTVSFSSSNLTMVLSIFIRCSGKTRTVRAMHSMRTRLATQQTTQQVWHLHSYIVVSELLVLIAHCTLQPFTWFQYWNSRVSCDIHHQKSRNSALSKYWNRMSDCSVQCAV